MTSDNVVWHQHAIDKAVRAARNRQHPCVIWFTGLSGSGKSTIAGLVEQILFEHGHAVYLLDGDNIRHGLSCDLGFDEADRIENIRRIGEVSRLFVDAGLIVLTAFISPFRCDRRQVRERLEPGEFLEIFVDAPLAVCEARDPKGLYRKARCGELPRFTGIDSPYEPPDSPDLTLCTAERGPRQCADMVVDELGRRGMLAA
jgi:adenylyl-sulfate kinase